MPGLLAAQIVAAAAHLFHDVTVADCRLSRLQTDLLRRFEEADVAHHRCNDCIMLQLTCPLHGIAADAQDIVAVDLFAVLVDRDQAVRIAVEG